MELQQQIKELRTQRVAELLRTGVDVNAAGGEYGSAIQAAGELGRSEILDMLLEHGADVNSSNIGTRNPHGRTPLSLAAGDGNAYIVRRLLDVGNINIELADVNGRTPLSWAAGNGGIEAVAALLVNTDIAADSKDTDGRTPLSWAAGNGQSYVVEHILQRREINADIADDSGRTPLSWAAGNGQQRAVESLLSRSGANADSQDGSGRSPLSWAAGNGQYQLVEMLLARQDVTPDSRDSNGRTPLSWAARNGHDKAVELLLKLPDVDSNSTDQDGIPPLWWAARNGHHIVVETLLRKENINVNYRDTDGRTLLSKTAEDGHDIVVKQLLGKEGLSPDSRDVHGRTALSWAAGAGRSAVVELLLGKPDVYPDSKDASDRTPLSWAAMNGHSTVVEILLGKEAADPNSTDKSGFSPLILALKNGRDRVVQLLSSKDTSALHNLILEDNRTLAESLLASGYDVDSVDASGSTALHLAFQLRNREFIELLLRNGAEIKGIMAEDWLGVYERRRTDGIEVREDINGVKRVGFLSRDALENIRVLPKIDRRLFIFPDHKCWPKELRSVGMDGMRRNQFQVSYQTVDVNTIVNNFNIPDWGECRIAWTLAPPAAASTRQWTSKDYYSTLPNGCIPNDGIDFYLQFLHQVEERWLKLCDGADEHLKRSRLDQLLAEGKNPDLMRRLAKDAQKWTELRSIMQDHADSAERFGVYYCERYNANKIPEELHKSVNELKVKVSGRINQLDQTIRDLLQFEFAWASINESRTSTRLGHNVMLFTYVSIFYLPLAFCASIWAIPNIADSDTRNPFIITAAIVGFITLFISFNLENIAALGRGLYQGGRAKILHNMQQDDHYWKKRGEELETSSPTRWKMPSEWWLLGYLMYKPVGAIKGFLHKPKQEADVSVKMENDGSSC